jgi:DNA-binding NarL/FixJ family response regulator
MIPRIVLADDHPIFRDGLVQSIEDTGEFQVVGVGESADDAVRLAAEHRPDIAVLDLSMPGGGIEAARRIAAAGTARAIAMLTVSEDDADVTAAIRAGAIGYVLKGVSAAELRRILKGIANGEAHVSPGLAAQVLRLMREPAKARRNPIDELTRREEEILRLVATGQSNKEVADALNLQERTVKHYMTEILGKLQARNRVEAALIAHEAWRERK